MRRTGARISDPAIDECHTVGDVYKKLIAKPKPSKLAQAIETDSNLVELVSMPNVKFQGRRVTPIDKEKEIGRWKVIEEELEARGLPVTGHSG
jgi:Ribosomal subunit 39S